MPICSSLSEASRLPLRNENCMCKPSADAKFIATARKESHPSDTTTASNEVQTSDSLIFSDNQLSDLQESASLIAESNQDRETQSQQIPSDPQPVFDLCSLERELEEPEIEEPEAAEDVPGTQQDTADASDLLALNHNDVLKEIEENDVQGQVAATTGQNAQPARQVASVECHVAPRNKKTKNVKYADSTDCLVCNQTVKRIDKHLINHKHLSSQITFIKDFHRTMNSQKQTKI